MILLLSLNTMLHSSAVLRLCSKVTLVVFRFCGNVGLINGLKVLIGAAIAAPHLHFNPLRIQQLERQCTEMKL